MACKEAAGDNRRISENSAEWRAPGGKKHICSGQLDPCKQGSCFDLTAALILSSYQ